MGPTWRLGGPVAPRPWSRRSETPHRLDGDPARGRFPAIPPSAIGPNRVPLLPLFGGYLFFCGEERQRIEVLRTNRVANLIDVQDQPRLVRELSQIEQALSAGVDLSPHKYLREGQLCKVIGGALAGLQGIVVRARDKTRLVLQIDMLGQATSVEIGADMIETVEENKTR